MQKVLTTGGAGFIGSEVVRQLVARGNDVVNLDALTYAGNLGNLVAVKNAPNYKFIHGSICDAGLVQQIINDFAPDAIVNLAAESHVDRSIDGPLAFFETNVIGTLTLLEAVRAVARKNDRAPRFVHVSTDEVFGSIEQGYCDESAPYRPSSPYAASKASSDHAAASYHTTFDLPVMVTNGSNTYGAFQFPEKLLPLHILNALEGKPLPIYGKGKNVREWLHVSDHASGIIAVLDRGKAGNNYNIGSRNERTNLEIIGALCGILDDEAPRADNRPHIEGIEFVTDRPGHDTRYALNSQKAKDKLGWECQVALDVGLRDTVRWYIANREWCDNITNGQYNRHRLGKL